ncbi:acyl-CoA dehydrogenase [gamma proteobacterium BDW918]|jgi:alkylation response protein AidB-like acyl-CoA dehydrogenase|uniref:Cyclohexane-1-carbonyl-CoA dehydrogenase n=1 Tax=Zhongshania aliphaticivorans TaxID=1470434 RepID=A0A127M301_9GAMM|nr:acyl-CoA dehydrogenase family protein [Zhongshania aliphaticivorans]AMO67602.1 acyl-CoA dehydrogenase [Zhongshania aliphaticivorans]EIF45060.1 acyl-CoA dehydrogenase [gamma proteobacterium BDW918]|tara:strand:+ start:3122 stop:4282 length:1161 start_codon:yes stop_codon:yes gene_type:complete
MDFNLSDDQKAFAESARSFADGIFKPNAAQWDAEHIFPKDALKQAGELGFMGMYTPEDAGGLGMSRLDTSVIVEELARGCTSTAAFLTIHNMATSMVGTYGKPALIEQWCGDLVMGEKLASYCLTEPSAGSDAGSLRSTARADGDNYIVNGSKMFISGAGSTDLLVVMLRTGADGPKGISAFAIPADAPGISYGKKEEKMGWNSQPTRTVSFEDVVVPAANMLGSEGQGFKIAMKGLDGGRINIATCSIGTAQAALEATIEYVKERKQFGQAIADFQNTQFKLADMTTDLVAARQMVRLAAFKLDSGDPEASTYCAMAKRFATDVCFTICNDALQLHGGYGYIKEYPLERHVRDSRVHQILEGTNEIMRVIIGRRLLIDGALEVIK